MPRSKYMKFFMLLVLGFFTMLLSGCFEIDYTIKINSDGTENITTKVTLPGIFAAQAGEAIQKFKEAGYGVITKTEGDKFLIIGSKTLKDYRWELPMVTDAKNAKFAPAVKNWLFFKTYEFNGEYLIEDTKKFKDPNNPYDSIQIPVRYTIELPGTVQSSNAANVSGTTLKWEFNYAAQSEHVVIKAKSYSINYVAIILGIIVLLGIGIPAIIRPSLRRQSISALIIIVVCVPLVLTLINKDKNNTDDKQATKTSDKPGTHKSSNKVKLVDIADLITWFMLNENEKPDWSMRINTGSMPIKWEDTSIPDINIKNKTLPERKGNAYVSINGAAFISIDEEKSPIIWHILQSGAGEINEVSLGPDEDKCFGKNASDCSFLVNSIRSDKIKFSELCKSGTPSNGEQLYEVSSPGKQKAYLKYSISSGSGGSSNGISLIYKNAELSVPQMACKQLLSQ